MTPAGASARCCSTGCPSSRSEARTATRCIRCVASDVRGLYPSPWRVRRPGEHVCLVLDRRCVVSAASAETRTLGTKAETLECRVSCVEGNLADQMRVAAEVAELLTVIFFEVEVPSWKEKEDSLQKSFARWWYQKQMELLILASMCFDGLQNKHALIIAAPDSGSAKTPSSAARDGSEDAGGCSGGGPGREESGAAFGKQEGMCVVGTADVSLIRVDSLLRKHLNCSKGETCALLTNMGVLERYRGRGVGSQLVQTAEAVALDLSPTPGMMMLYVYKDNPKGISLYKSQGFSETDWLDPDWAAAAERSRPGAPRRLLMAKPLRPAS